MTDPTRSQLRMWFMHAMNPRRTDLTIACAAHLRSRMSLVELQERLRSVVMANPLLAAMIVETSEGPRWRQITGEDAVRSAVAPTVRAPGLDDVPALYAQFIGQPWNLERDVPWTVQLVSAGPVDFLFCRFHHIVCDGDRSLRLFLDDLTTPHGVPDGAELARLLAEPERSTSWDATVARLTAAITGVGNLRDRIAERGGGPGRYRWRGTLHTTDADEPDGALLLARLRAATAHLVRDEQLLVAVPFDNCTDAQQGHIGYFGNPGLAVLPPDGSADGWAAGEYARAEELALVPFQVVMADDAFRRSVHQDNPFDILLVPRSLFGYESPLVASVLEPVPSETPYALVLNHWRDIEGDLHVALESTVFGQDVVDFLGSELIRGADVVPVRTGRSVRPEPDMDIVPRLLDAVRAHRQDVAIDTPTGRHLTYAELWDRTVNLADFLDGNLRGSHPTVAIIGDKHPNEIMCVLATHVVGGTVLRLDRDQEATRRAMANVEGIAAIIWLDDAHSAVSDVVVEDEYTLDGPFGAYRVSFLRADPSSCPGERFGQEPPLYITLTSGSTGLPKPIPFPRAEFNSLIAWHLRTFPSPRRMMQFSPLSFDIAYHVIYATLCGGGTLVLGDRKIRQDPRALLEYLNSARIEKIYLPTVLLRPLAEFAMAGDTPMPTPALREVIVAGGILEITDEIRDWFTHTSARLFNNYGMSETQDVTSHLLAGPPRGWPNRPAAGRPIDGVDVQIVGARGRELPRLLSGSVVVRTAAGQTVTGDVGYKDHDGLLHIIGRQDRVIKQRGYRLNLQALEAEVGRAPGVADAVAVHYRSTAGATVVAVVATVQHPGGSVDLAGIRERTVAALGPGYEFDLHVVSRIPRLPNAKPDLLAIAGMARQLADESTEERARDTRADTAGSVVLAAVRRLVRHAAVDERSRFLDVGLDSISLMSLAAGLKADYPDLSIAHFFQHPTIGDLQRYLDNRPADHAGTPRRRTRQPGDDSAPVSVVGLACRFPGASDVDTFWRNLLAGRDALVRRDAPDAGSAFVGVNGVLSDVDEFDHAFFGITPAEARRMDPQIRLFLELCWTAMENAGEAGGIEHKTIGIFAGGGMSTYLMNEVEPRRHGAAGTPFLEDNTLPERLGNDRNYLTSTVSYRLGLTGPSIVVQAACATSLTAVHLARQALLAGECDIALAGGVSIIYPQPDGYEYVEGSVRSRAGACRPFDRNADGTVFGNGAGVVVLKRATDASADRNTVYADVIGSAVNHDGSVKGSFSAPNPASQTRVIDAAIESASGARFDLDFVEAHGTGTHIGDAIEWNALLGSRINTRETPSPCVVGSVKANVGHLDEAAGIAGFIKACLSARYRVYPGTVGFTGLHQHLTRSDRFTVSAANTRLPHDRPVYGGVSSFGMGGANCHVIVRSPDPTAGTSGQDGDTRVLAEHTEPVYLPVSGRTGDALRATADRLIAHLDDEATQLTTASVIRTLVSGRRHFTEHRGVLYRADTTTTLVTPAGLTAQRPTVVWAFPGQGSGFSWSVVAGLSRWPMFGGTFRRLLTEFEQRLGSAVFRAHVGVAVAEPPYLRPAPSDDACLARCTIREQVLQFAFQAALAQLLTSFGIRPDVVVGHSLGEITAAVTAGRITEPDALRLVAERSWLMETTTPPGFMTQLGCEPAVARELAAALDLDVAAINGPRQIVLAGDVDRADDLARLATQRDIRTVRLPAGKAFHSRLMADAATYLGALDWQPSTTPSPVRFVSSHSGHGATDGPTDLDYWATQITAAVDYLSACRAVLSGAGRTLFLELGFNSTLSNLMRAAASADSAPPPALTGGIRQKAVPEYVARVVAAAYQAGTSLDWAEINRSGCGGLVPLPTYAFARTVIPPYGGGAPARAARSVRRARPVEPSGDVFFPLCPQDEDWILEHRVDGRYVVPAAGILALFARTDRMLRPSADESVVSDIAFERPIVLASADTRVDAKVSVADTEPRKIALWTRPAGSTGDWERNATALLTDDAPPAADADETAADTDQPSRHVGADELYLRFEAQQLRYGPSYRGLCEVTGGPRTASAAWRTGVPAENRTRIDVSVAHVAAIDGVLQVADVLGDTTTASVRLPAYIAYARLRTVDRPSPVQHITVRGAADRYTGTLRDGGLGIVAELHGIRFESARPTTVAHELRWFERIAVGADRPDVVADEVERTAAWLSAPDDDVTEYQRQMRVLEDWAPRILRDSVGSAHVQDTDRTDPAARRRTRAFGEFLRQASPTSDELPESIGRHVATEWSILRNCAPSLPRFFDGALDGATILFGGAGADHLRTYYQSSFLLRRLNRAVHRLISALTTAGRPRALRILEVGGGTGATTEGVLAALHDVGAPVDYTFTDVSVGLLRLAGNRFGHHPGFRTATVDLESDESVSALGGGYDVVIAVDVIHATTDVARTLDRLAGQMSPDGTLLVVEDLKQLAWVDLTFGLLDSWWSFSDGLRDDHPLLTVPQWQDLLSARFGRLDTLRACGGLPPADTVADEGLFVCSNPRSADVETTVVDITSGENVTGLLNRIASRSSAGTLAVRFDAGSVVLDPHEAEWFAYTLLRVLRSVEATELRDVVLCTTDARVVDDAVRVLTAGSMAAALARVATREGRRVNTFSLAVDAGTDTSTLADQVATLVRHAHPHVNGAVVDGRLYVPHVVETPTPEPVPAEFGHDCAVLFGGESGIAAAAAEWLVTTAGIDRIYLVGRSAPQKSTVDFIDRLRARGQRVEYLAADVGDAAAVRAVAVTVAAESSRPLVLNLAGALRDATIDRVTTSELAAVFRPKVHGSHHIESAFRDLPGAHVVLFSSTSALLGNAGQAAHAMACAFTDGLADASVGGTSSVGWGPWSDVGITARLGMNDRLRRAGEYPSPAAVLLPELGRAALRPAGSAIAADLGAPALRRQPFLAALLPAPRHTPMSRQDGGHAVRSEPPATGSDVVRAAVAAVLGVPADDIATDRSLADNGVDSLNLIEIRALIERWSGEHVPLHSLSDAPSVDAVRESLVPGRSATPADLPAVCYVAGIFGRIDAAPDLEQAVGPVARLVTLAAPTRAAGTPGSTDVVEVARDLADEIERIRPTGPITVVGHSFGAMLAYSACVELRRRGRQLAQLVLVDGEPVAALARSAPAPDDEFDTLLGLSTRDARSPALTDDSRATALDNYRTNCAIARSPQIIGELECPVLVVVPETYTGVGLPAGRALELRRTAMEKLGATSVDVVSVPGDHFTMLRSPNVDRLVTHIRIPNQER